MRILRYSLMLFLSSLSLIARGGDFVSNGLVYCFGSRSGEVIVVENIIDGLNSYSGVCIIPTTVNYDGDNYKVTAISELAFADSHVTDVVIPNTVTEIGEFAFDGCDDLVNVTLPLSLKEIPEGCFSRTNIVNIALPEGLEVIGRAAFEECYQLHTALLPSTLRRIEASAFNDCHNLYEIYCASPIPPKANGWGTFAGVNNVDIVVPDYEAVDSYLSDKAWGAEKFTLYPNEDIFIPSLEEGDAFEQDWQRVPLGNNLAYKVFDENDELVAVTAADYCYLTSLDHDAIYTIVPTTMMSDSDPISVMVDKTTGIDSLVLEEFPVEPEPIIVSHWGTIYIYGNTHGKLVSVWDMSGRLYYERMSSDNHIVDLPRNRVYVVRVGNYVKKLFI